MFVLVTLTDKVRVAPADFRKDHLDAVKDEINRKYSDKIIHQTGLCISMYDILEWDDPYVFPNDGGMHIKVKFRMIVFRPFIGEVLVGKVKRSTKDGLQVSVDFFDDIFIPASHLQEGTSFNTAEQLWVWEYNDNELFMDLQEEIRFRVAEESFMEIFPGAEVRKMMAQTKATALAARPAGAPAAAAAAAAAPPGASGLMKPPPTVGNVAEKPGAAGATAGAPSATAAAAAAALTPGAMAAAAVAAAAAATTSEAGTAPYTIYHPLFIFTIKSQIMASIFNRDR